MFLRSLTVLPAAFRMNPSDNRQRKGSPLPRGWKLSAPEVSCRGAPLVGQGPLHAAPRLLPGWKPSLSGSVGRPLPTTWGPERDPRPHVQDPGQGQAGWSDEGPMGQWAIMGVGAPWNLLEVSASLPSGV